VVDSLNLVYLHLITFLSSHFLHPFDVFLMSKSDLDDRFYHIPASIRFICFKQPLESANQSVFESFH
jgi:hypothetical protein